MRKKCYEYLFFGSNSMERFMLKGTLFNILISALAVYLTKNLALTLTVFFLTQSYLTHRAFLGERRANRAQNPPLLKVQ